MNKRIFRTFTRIEAILAVILLVIAFFVKEDTTRIVCRVAAIVMLAGVMIQGKIVNNIQDDINSGKEQKD
jgi:RsiW-degrading membrane proteinase PrsW (M82 family)